MKIIEKIALIIYSIIVLILSVVCCLLIFNWLQLDSIINILENMLEYHYISTTVLVVSIIFILLCLPQALVLCDKFIEKGTYKCEFVEDENGNE